MYDAPNAVEKLKQPRKHPAAEKVEAMKDALTYFEVMQSESCYWKNLTAQVYIDLDIECR